MFVSIVSVESSIILLFFFFFNDTATTEIYTLSLHDALPIFGVFALLGEQVGLHRERHIDARHRLGGVRGMRLEHGQKLAELHRSEEHTSELQSRQYLVCRLLLEKKKKES